MRVILFILIIFTFVACSNDPDEKLLIAKSNINKGAYETARYHLNDILKSDSSIVEAYFLLGKLENQSEYFEDAKKYLDKCILLNPEYIDAYQERAYSFKKLGLDNEAINDLTKLIELYSIDGSIFLERGLLFMNIGKLDEACQDWKKASELGNSEGLRFYQKFCKTPEFE